jgi:hypothetical protein
MKCPRYGQCLDAEWCQQGAPCAEAVDLAAIRSDDNLIDDVVAGSDMSPEERARILDLLDNPQARGISREATDEILAGAFAGWRAEIEAQPIGRLVEVEAAIAAIRSNAGDGRRHKRIRRAVRSLFNRLLRRR